MTPAIAGSQATRSRRIVIGGRALARVSICNIAVAVIAGPVLGDTPVAGGHRPWISVTEVDVPAVLKPILEPSSPIHIEIPVATNLGFRDFPWGNPSASLRDLGANRDQAGG